jgi:hypothetical protein
MLTLSLRPLLLLLKLARKSVTLTTKMGTVNVKVEEEPGRDRKKVL